MPPGHGRHRQRAFTGSHEQKITPNAEYERPVNSQFTGTQHRRTASSGCCRIREGPAISRAWSIGSTGEPQSMTAARTTGCAIGRIRTLKRQLAHDWGPDSSSFWAWVAWVRV